MHICVKYPMMINLKTFLNTLLEKYKKMKFLYDVTTRVRKIFYGLKSLNVCFSKIYQHNILSCSYVKRHLFFLRVVTQDCLV